MTTTKASGKKATYIRHSQEYKGEALKLAVDLGIAKADTTRSCDGGFWRKFTCCFHISWFSPALFSNPPSVPNLCAWLSKFLWILVILTFDIP